MRAPMDTGLFLPLAGVMSSTLKTMRRQMQIVLGIAQNSPRSEVLKCP
jgi:hypothetical protein